MSAELYAAYLLATLAVVFIPGPTATLVIANSLKHGARSGLLNVAGTQLGLAAMIGVVGIGLTSMVEAMGHWFDWVRIAGALYLMWLGWKMIRNAGGDDVAGAAHVAPRGGFVLQGAVVALSNPKTLLFFGAFFPQFVDPSRDFAFQIFVMGLTAMAVAAIVDGSIALAAGRAGHLLSAKRVRLMSRVSGTVLISGGVWLALSRR
jgi:threonine/homoserine/homoserine lactone efflux protein